MTENKRFKHTFNGIGMQFISYDGKNVSMGTFADEESIDCIVDLLNELSEENEHLKQQLNEVKAYNNWLVSVLQDSGAIVEIKKGDDGND